MGKYTILQMFENRRRGRQARNFTINVPKILDRKLSSEQIFSENCRWVPLLYTCMLKQPLRTSYQLTVNINCTVLGVVPDDIPSNTQIYSSIVSTDVQQARDNFPCTFEDPLNTGPRITSHITPKCCIITLNNWSGTLIDCHLWRN